MKNKKELYEFIVMMVIGYSGLTICILYLIFAREYLCDSVCLLMVTGTFMFVIFIVSGMMATVTTLVSSFYIMAGIFCVISGIWNWLWKEKEIKMIPYASDFKRRKNVSDQELMSMNDQNCPEQPSGVGLSVKRGSIKSVIPLSLDDIIELQKDDNGKGIVVVYGRDKN